MKEEFIDYLKNLYWLHVQYDMSKAFNISSFAINCEEMYIWEYEGIINVSGHYDYVNMFKKAYMLNKNNNDEYAYPNILYKTKDKNEMQKIMKTLFIQDYEQLIKELMKVINNDKTLSLVDNGNGYKYN